MQLRAGQWAMVVLSAALGGCVNADSLSVAPRHFAAEPTRPPPTRSTFLVENPANSTRVGENSLRAVLPHRPPAPPPAPPDRATVQPTRDSVWVPGYYTYLNSGRYEWVPGHWEVPPSAGRKFAEPRWEQRGDRYVFIDAHWR